MLITSSMKPLFLHIRPFLVRMFFRTIWSAASCIEHSTVDGNYQLLMRASDIPLTAVSTPSGMLWEGLVMPQGLSNASATFYRLVTQFFVLIDDMHRLTSMTFLSIVALGMVDRISTIILFISKRCLSVCAQISSTLMRITAYLVLKNFPF